MDIALSGRFLAHHNKKSRGQNCYHMVQGLFQLFLEKAPGLNWEKYAAFWEFLEVLNRAGTINRNIG